VVAFEKVAKYLASAPTFLTEVDIFLFTAVHSNTLFGGSAAFIFVEFQLGHVIEKLGEMAAYLTDKLASAYFKALKSKYCICQENIAKLTLHNAETNSRE